MSHYVYIIESLKSGQWYFGYSTELDRRLEGHNIGLNKSTRVDLGGLFSFEILEQKQMR
jgi:predicted GIY-YIG superfamily endonuclease